ncbi:MAG: hypothetical protein KKB34_14140 [Bacteroidetes bacterium]|nr:hypothetical protein [Bacteroidota bacterium]
MRKKKYFSSWYLFAAVITQIFIGCYSQNVITSGYSSEDITIDGQQMDWENKLNFVEDNKMSVGFTNNDDYLFVALITSDRININKILTLGLTVWLEPENGKKIGVRFPQKFEMKSLGMMRPESGIDNDGNERNLREEINELIASNKEISILNEDEYSLYLFDGTNKVGFSAELGLVKGQFVYELQIPLEGNSLSPITLNANPGEKVEIEIVTGEFEKPEMAGNRSIRGSRDGSAAGGMGRQGAGSKGRSGGGNRMADSNQKIDYSATLLLSKPN